MRTYNLEHRNAKVHLERTSSPYNDKTLACDSSTVSDQNCKDFDRTKFTKMIVWVTYLYWSGAYPTGPDDARCNKLQSPSSKSKVRWPKRKLILKHKPKHQKE
ncbi:hypothetical protein OS493_040363 [Desmophyllum pertusum]|uniref:Uncharacterized protein n=1 Tax=Desmophyllum pertusum TaxID=174260 RepID=A0A9W9ZH23_9CNID|nr:hypothetical protein OS493_040363 [Desmophyllum pertusum]